MYCLWLTWDGVGKVGEGGRGVEEVTGRGVGRRDNRELDNLIGCILWCTSLLGMLELFSSSLPLPCLLVGSCYVNT